jgi:methionine--tRNA ligase beta chain
MATLEEFKSLDIRVGKILEAKTHETARKPMYVLRIDFGGEIGERTIVAGIRDKYEREELEGKSIACIINLEPKKVAGVDSNGMILAAENSEGVVSILVPDKQIEAGSRVH